MKKLIIAALLPTDYRQTTDYRQAVINAFFHGAITKEQKDQLLYNVILCANTVEQI